MGAKAEKEKEREREREGDTYIYIYAQSGGFPGSMSPAFPFKQSVMQRNKIAYVNHGIPKEIETVGNHNFSS